MSTKFSDVLHILLHLAESKSPITSENLAKAMQTNPVVVRKIMAGMREKGLVASEKGHGGGWQLTCNLEAVTLHDVYIAIGSPTMIALRNRTDSSECHVEKAVSIATNNAFADAEKALVSRFHETTLADLSTITAKRLHGKQC